MFKSKLSILALLFVIFAMSGSIFAKQSQKDSAPPAAATPTPTPEMDRLKFYIGEWNYTETYEKTPFYPTGGKNGGLYTSTRGPGGNSLVQHFHSQAPAGDFEGMMVITWDPKDKAYKSYVFGNDFSGCIVEIGQFEGDTLVFRGEFAMGEAKIAVCNTTRLVAPGKIISEEYMARNGAPEKLFVTVDAVKK
jgi:hypothetical protein